MTGKPRSLLRPFTSPWGKGQIMEKAPVARDHCEPTIQLMEYDDGSAARRFCFYSGGRFNRNQLILSDSDLDELARERERTPHLKARLRRLAS
jgi:hypothetical protein